MLINTKSQPISLKLILIIKKHIS